MFRDRNTKGLLVQPELPHPALQWFLEARHQLLNIMAWVMLTPSNSPCAARKREPPPFLFFFFLIVLISDFEIRPPFLDPAAIKKSYFLPAYFLFEEQI